MSVELTDREHQIIQQLILDRWNPHRINKKIANHHGLTINQVKYMRSKPAFKAEYDKQLAIYLDSFDDIQLADRKERVKALAGLYEKIPNPRVALKLKVLKAIREEVGDDRPIEVEHHHQGVIGLNLPPRASTYEEWVEQNRQMARAVSAVQEPPLAIEEAQTDG